MYNYHLLDFFPLYKTNDDVSNPFFRSRFILKLKMSYKKHGKLVDDYYVIVSLTQHEATNIFGINKKNRILNIFNNTPKNLDYYTSDYIKDVSEPDNEKITLTNNVVVNRYQLIDPQSTDIFTKKLHEYIITSEQIRERLLITIFNFIYENAMTHNGSKNIIDDNPTHILVNIYEGDIDKILTVV